MRYYQFCIRTKVQEASGVGVGGLAILVLVSVSVFTNIYRLGLHAKKQKTPSYMEDGRIFRMTTF